VWFRHNPIHENVARKIYGLTVAPGRVFPHIQGVVPTLLEMAILRQQRSIFTEGDTLLAA
jgi:hypothetical protein